MTSRLLITAAFLLAACTMDLGELPDDALRTERLVTPTTNEQVCTAPGRVFTPPVALLDADGRCDPERETYCLRLSAELRAAAAAHDPRESLAASVRRYDEYLAGDEAALASAQAFADLAVTGAQSYARFRATPPTAVDLADAGSREAVAFALERAYAVVWAVRGPPSARALRPELGYVAVSSEDDLPDRPVNIPAAAHPSVDAWLEVPLADGTPRTVRTRVVIATTEPVAPIELPEDRVGHVPAALPLAIPETGDVIVFVHGHSSLAEEGAGLIDALIEHARQRGDALTVLAFDQPSNGYSERVDPSIVVGADGNRDDALLRYLDAVVIAFVDAVEAGTPGARDRIRAVIGGSLGGNLVLRLGESGVAWPTRLVAWSPASIDRSWRHARWPLAAGEGDFVDLVKHEAVRMTRDASEEPEEDGSRAHYFVGGLTSIRNQASYWYREGWEPCRSSTIDEGLVQLAEVYDARYRRWHYRLAFEQLVFSHLEPDEEGQPRRFRRIELPLLLVTGRDDDSVPMQTFTFVERLAPHLSAPGETLFIEDTGHALHTERPELLAEAIEGFAL